MTEHPSEEVEQCLMEKAAVEDRLYDLSDEEVVEELSRNGCMWYQRYVSQAESDTILIKDALRRILQNQLDAKDVI